MIEKKEKKIDITIERVQREREILLGKFCLNSSFKTVAFFKKKLHIKVRNKNVPYIKITIIFKINKGF